MKKAYKRVITLMMLLLMVLTLAGCEQLSGLTSLLPGAEKGAEESESGEPASETGLVSGDISELQTPSSWVYLIEESSEEGQSSSGILVYNPELAGYETDSVVRTEAFIEWDGREFDLDSKPCSAKGWYMSVPLATNIRKDSFVLRVNLIRGEEEEKEEIRLENPKIELLGWPAPVSKDGIIMQKEGSTYSFSAEKITDLFQCDVPALFTYSIKDCVDCNVKLEGDTLSYLNIASKDAAFTVQITDPAGAVQETQIRIHQEFSLKPYLLGAAAAAVIIAAVLLFLFLRGRGGEGQSAEAEKALVDLLARARNRRVQCDALPDLAVKAKAEALGMIGKHGLAMIDKSVINNLTDGIEQIRKDADYVGLSNMVSDLEEIQEILGKSNGFAKRKLMNKKSAHMEWTAASFLNPATLKEHVADVSGKSDDLDRVYEDALQNLNDLKSYANIGKDPFCFDFAIEVNVNGKIWKSTFNHRNAIIEKTGSYVLEDCYFRSEGEQITSGRSFLSERTAKVQVFSKDDNSILLFSGDGFQIMNKKKNSLKLQKNEELHMTVAGAEEEIRAIGSL